MNEQERAAAEQERLVGAVVALPDDYIPWWVPADHARRVGVPPLPETLEPEPEPTDEAEGT